jgi:hypothetical protein
MSVWFFGLVRNRIRDLVESLTYADLPQVRSWRACAQLDIAGVFAVRKSEPALSVLFSELSTGQEARAVPVSELYV